MAKRDLVQPFAADHALRRAMMARVVLAGTGPMGVDMAKPYSHLDANVNDTTRITMRSHNNADRGTMWRMPKVKAFNPEQRRRVLRDYIAAENLTVNGWARAAGISEGTLRNFLNGDSDSLSDRSYELLAAVRSVPVSLLRGEKAARSVHPEIPVRSFVGAGDEIISLTDDEDPIDWTPAPPGLEDAEATEVRGMSMLPLYREGDLLFHRRMTIDPMMLRDEICVMQTKSRKRYVKLIQPGLKKGTFRLVSFNPLFPPLEDQVLTWVSPILAMRRARWMPRRRLISASRSAHPAKAE